MKNLDIITSSFVILFLLNSCDKEESPSFDGSIASIEKFYTPELVGALLDLGFQINEGSNPPNINGDYLISPMELFSTTVPSDRIGRIFDDYLTRFSNQNNSNLTIDMYGYGGGEVDDGSGSFISGDNNQFSVFLKITSQIGNYPSTSAFSFSGEFTDEGIYNIQFAVLMLDNKGNIEEVYIENNTGRVFIDNNGVSPRQ